MSLLPALTIGLMFGLVAGIVVYFIIDYYEAEKTESRESSAFILHRHVHPQKYRLDLAKKIQDVATNTTSRLPENKQMEVPSDSIVIVFNGSKNVLERKN